MSSDGTQSQSFGDFLKSKALASLDDHEVAPEAAEYIARAIDDAVETVERSQFAEDPSEQVVANLDRWVEEIRRQADGGAVTEETVAIALRGLCPIFPFC